MIVGKHRGRRGILWPTRITNVQGCRDAHGPCNRDSKKEPARRVARAQAGLKLGEFDRATQKYGLATTLGAATTTGISGLTLGGGYGWLAGKYGLACDNLIRAEVVTADGKIK
ncbi:MAG: FAD-binding protein [Steroidobacteraceae bacterium]